MKMTATTSQLLASACLILLGIVASAEAKSKPYLTNDEIFDHAKGLESAELLQDDVSAETISKRTQLLYNFARPIKSDYAKSQFELINKLSNEYKFKAYDFVKDNSKESQKNKNWFTSNLSKIMNPMNSMKNFAKKYPFLQDINRRYEEQAKDGLLSHDDVDCDLIKFQITQLYNIYFALQTDIKYLITGDQQILNRAIYDQLKADSFTSENNFFELIQFNDRQRNLLLNYYSNHSNSLTTNVGSSVDHFYEPGEFIIGRLLDSCQTVNHFESIWRQLEDSRRKTCKLSSSDKYQENFVQFYNEAKYDEIFALCAGLFAAMK